MDELQNLPLKIKVHIRKTKQHSSPNLYRIIFFLEHAGELCIIILRRKRGFKKSKQHHSPTLTHTHMLTSTAITLTNTWKKTPLTTRPSQKWLLERGGEKLLEPQPSSINVGPLSWNVELHSG